MSEIGEKCTRCPMHEDCLILKFSNGHSADELSEEQLDELLDSMSSDEREALLDGILNTVLEDLLSKQLALGILITLMGGQIPFMEPKPGDTLDTKVPDDDPKPTPTHESHHHPR